MKTSSQTIFHYESFTMPACRKPLILVREGAGEPWIDLRSVIQALGMSWPRWSMYFSGQREAFALVRHDHQLPGTLLVSPSKVMRVLAHLYTLQYPNIHTSAARRIGELHWSWAEHWALAQGIPAPAPASYRKVDADTVRGIWDLRQQGDSFGVIARKLGISLATVKQVSSGTYPMAPDAIRAWADTFGNPKARRGLLHRCNGLASSSGGGSVARQLENAATAPQSDAS